MNEYWVLGVLSIALGGSVLLVLCAYLFVWYVAPYDTPRLEDERDGDGDETVQKLSDLGYMD